MTQDITTLEDIKLLVNTFYGRVQKDELIGPIFNARIQNSRDKHLAKMYTIWQTVLLDEHTYYGRPFPPHAELPVEMEHFDRWLAILKQTIDEIFEGTRAEEAKWRGAQMAKMFLSKIEYFRELKQKPLM